MVTNGRIYTSIGKSPFFVNLERHPKIHREGKESIQKVSEIYKFIWEIKEARKKIEKALKKTNKIIKKKTDKTRREAIEYKEGDIIWVDGSNISPDCLTESWHSREQAYFQ